MATLAESIAQNFMTSYSLDGEGDDYRPQLFGGLTLGVVIDTDDPLQGGRLRVFCPSLNDNPAKIDTIPWSAYVSPFSGSINNSEFYRGMDEDKATSTGSLHYGFWAIPEMGAHVLVGCVDGDPRRRFWIGCMPEHQQTNSLHHGRYKWNEGTIDGPLTGSDAPMQPLYDNMLEAFDNQNDRPEWRSRVAEYQTSANLEDEGQTPNSVNTSLDQGNAQIIANTPEEYEHEQMGAHGNDWSGFKQLGNYLSSRVFGWSTPGMHAITMDDRAFNQRIRLRTTSGHQILLDDTNERIYISTFKGNNFVEMDVNGNIDMFSENRISIHAAKDLNLNADMIRMYARRGIHGYSGSQFVLQDSFSDEVDPDGIKKQDPLEVPPQDGEIRFHSSADMHIKSEMNIRQLSLKDTFMESNGNWYGKVDLSSFYQVKNEINIITDDGDYSLNVGKNLNETVTGNSKRFTYGTSAISSNGRSELMSFESSVDVGGLDNVNVKSSSGDVSLEAMGNGSGQGNVQMRSPTSQLEVGNDGVSGMTDKDVKFKSGGDTEFEVTQSSPGLSSPVSVSGLPEIDSSGATPVTPPGPIPWDGSRSRITIDEAVRVAYNAGWRDKDLPIAVAVMMAESSFRTTATNNAAPKDNKWDDVVGLFQIRTLKNPDAYTGVDRLRDNRNHQLENPNRNAEVAYQIWAQSAPQRQWTVGKWESFGGRHQGKLITNNLQAATEAVNRYLGTKPSPNARMAVTAEPELFYDVQGEMVSALSVHGLSASNPNIMRFGSVGTGALTQATQSAIQLGKQKASLQGMSDIEFRTKSLAGNNNSFNAMITKINESVAGVDQLNMFMATMIPKIIQGLATAGSFTLELPFGFNLPCLSLNIYDALMPQALLNVAATLEDLNAMVEGLVQVPIDLYNIVDELQGNVAALTALGLPLDFSFPLDPSMGLCLEEMEQLTGNLKMLDIPALELPVFDSLPAQILSNNTIRVSAFGG